MIDNFALALSHGLLALAAWRLIWRLDLEDDGAPTTPQQLRWPIRRADEDPPRA